MEVAPYAMKLVEFYYCPVFSQSVVLFTMVTLLIAVFFGGVVSGVAWLLQALG